MPELATVESLEFLVSSGKVCISDPCYKRDTWCGVYDVPAIKGFWRAWITKNALDGRVLSVRARSLEILDQDPPHPKWFDFGVDSGQLGMFDSVVYQNDVSVPEGADLAFKVSDDLTKWYSYVCRQTLNKEASGAIIGGFVTSTGYGDGSYRGQLTTNSDGELQEFFIEYINDDFYDEDDDEE